MQGTPTETDLRRMGASIKQGAEDIQDIHETEESNAQVKKTPDEKGLHP